MKKVVYEISKNVFITFNEPKEKLKIDNYLKKEQEENQNAKKS